MALASFIDDPFRDLRVGLCLRTRRLIDRVVGGTSGEVECGAVEVSRVECEHRVVLCKTRPVLLHCGMCGSYASSFLFLVC